MELPKNGVVPQERIAEILSGYDLSKLRIATLCSHSALQIFEGAAAEGFETVPITTTKNRSVYEAHASALRTHRSIMELSSWKEILKPARQQELRDANVIVVPHGSFVAHVGASEFARTFEVPTFGNRRSLPWEADRSLQMKWLSESGVRVPKEVKPDEIDALGKPVFVKYWGAEGGKDAFIARNFAHYDRKVDKSRPHTIQECLVGTRAYPHFFWSPIDRAKPGYRDRKYLSKGSLEMLSADVRVESNIDEASRLGGVDALEELEINPTFVVVGNKGLVLRESLLPSVYSTVARAVTTSIELFGGMVGPFCFEGIIGDDLEFYVFEVSQRIVAGTNVYPNGGPYAWLLHGEPMSTGRRIARELKLADGNLELLKQIVY